MKSGLDHARILLEKAGNDLKPEIGLEHGAPTDTIAFHLQQAAEKILKSFLKNPPFTQNFGPFTSAGSSGGFPSLFLSDVPPLLVFNDAVNPAGVLSQPVTNYKAARSRQFNGVLEKQLGGFVISAG